MAQAEHCLRYVEKHDYDERIIVSEQIEVCFETPDTSSDRQSWRCGSVLPGSAGSLFSRVIWGNPIDPFCAIRRRYPQPITCGSSQLTVIASTGPR